MALRKQKLSALVGSKAFIPPRCSKYVSWGFPDHSLRLCALSMQSDVSSDGDEVSARAIEARVDRTADSLCSSSLCTSIYMTDRSRALLCATTL